MAIHSSGKNWSKTTRQVAEEVDALFPRKEWTSTYPGHGENSAKGAYAIDFMCNKEDGDQIFDYLWKHRKRLGIRYLIWWGKIISETSSTPNRVVRYFNAGHPNPSKSHKNHVHASRYPNGVYRALVKVIDKVTNVVSKPKPYPEPREAIVYDSKVVPGQVDSDSVWWIQKALNAVELKGGSTLVLDGDYGPSTEARVKLYQSQKCGDIPDGDLGPKQTRYLFELAGIKVKHVDAPKGTSW